MPIGHNLDGKLTIVVKNSFLEFSEDGGDGRDQTGLRSLRAAGRSLSDSEIYSYGSSRASTAIPEGEGDAEVAPASALEGERACDHERGGSGGGDGGDAPHRPAPLDFEAAVVCTPRALADATPTSWADATDVAAAAEAWGFGDSTSSSSRGGYYHGRMAATSWQPMDWGESSRRSPGPDAADMWHRGSSQWGRGGGSQAQASGRAARTANAERAGASEWERRELERAAVEEIQAQLSAGNRRGGGCANGSHVWLSRWSSRFGHTLGSLRQFLESRPDEFEVVPGWGKSFTVLSMRKDTHGSSSSASWRHGAGSGAAARATAPKDRELWPSLGSRARGDGEPGAEVESTQSRALREQQGEWPRWPLWSETAAAKAGRQRPGPPSDDSPDEDIDRTISAPPAAPAVGRPKTRPRPVEISARGGTSASTSGMTSAHVDRRVGATSAAATVQAPVVVARRALPPAPLAAPPAVPTLDRVPPTSAASGEAASVSTRASTTTTPPQSPSPSTAASPSGVPLMSAAEKVDAAGAADKGAWRSRLPPAPAAAPPPVPPLEASKPNSADVGLNDSWQNRSSSEAGAPGAAPARRSGKQRSSAASQDTAATSSAAVPAQAARSTTSAAKTQQSTSAAQQQKKATPPAKGKAAKGKNAKGSKAQRGSGSCSTPDDEDHEIFRTSKRTGVATTLMTFAGGFLFVIASALLLQLLPRAD